MDILLFIAIVPVFLIGLYVYNKDPHKEPSKLIKNLFIRGVLSAILTLIITEILNNTIPFFAQDTDSMTNAFELAISVFVGIALVEEFSKWIMLYTKTYNNSEFDELYDMIVYSVMVSLGFACIENILYVYAYGIQIGIYRAIFAVPGHAFDAIFMGLFLTYAKKNQNLGNKNASYFYRFLSILVPTILHGIYDYSIMLDKDASYVVFFVFVLILYIISFKVVKKVSLANQNIGAAPQVNNYQNQIYNNAPSEVICPVCGNRVSGNFCSNCGWKRNDIV